jgi:hypothetical protein
MSFDSDYDVWAVYIEYSDGSGDSGYKFTRGTEWTYNWGSGDNISLNNPTVLNTNTGNCLFDQEVGKYYHFTFYHVIDYVASKTVLQKLSAAPNTISDITEPVTVYQDESMSFTITLSGSKVSEESVYLCYTTDNWSTRSNELASGSSSNWSVTIPRQSIGTTVKFYAMTTTSETPWGDDEALFTLDHKYSASNPFSYTISDRQNQTYHTIEINGENDFSTVTERTNASGDNNYWWYTWDESNFYFAFQQGALDENNASKWVIHYIDTDPQINPILGTGTTTGLQYNTQQPTLPFTANYQFQWNTSGEVLLLKEYNSESWGNVTEHNMIANLNTSNEFFEVKIPLSSLNNPEMLYICGNMLDETLDGEYMWAFTPENASSDNNDGAHKNLDSFWSFELVSGKIPNDANNVDNPLPVTLSSFTAVFDGEVPVLHWETASEINNSGWNVYRSVEQQASGSMQMNSVLIEGKGTIAGAAQYEYIDLCDYDYDLFYYYWLESVDYSSNTELYGPIALFIPLPENDNNSPDMPVTYGLHPNCPNPFNPSTELSFTLDYDSKVTLEIYNIKGKKLITLIEDAAVAKSERKSFVWDGKDSEGNSCASGIYFYKLRTNREVFIRKMIMAK